MAFSLVHAAESAVTSGTNTITVTSTTAGNLLVCAILEYNFGSSQPATPTTPTNWTAPAGTGTSQLVGVEFNWGAGQLTNYSLYYYPNCPSGLTSVAIAVGANTDYSTAFYGEFSGATTTSPLDQAGNNGTATAGTSLTMTTAGATSVGSELGFLTAWNTSGANPETISASGWASVAAETDGATNVVGASFWQTTGAAGTITGTTTWTDSVESAGLIATFKPTGGVAQTEAIRMII